MKIYSLFFICLFFAFTTNAQTIFWTGNSSQHWEDPDNWDTNTIPGPNDDVYIGSTSDPVIYEMESSTIKSLLLGGTAQVIIEKEATLEMYKPNNRGIRINNNASLTNKGTLSFASIPGEGILVRGSFVNEGTGLMKFKAVNREAIEVSTGSFSNHGYVHLLGGNIGPANVGQGIYVNNNSSMINTGVIEIEQGYPGHFRVNNNSNVANNGLMDFRTINVYSLQIFNGSAFFNLSNAILDIESFTDGFPTIYTLFGSTFENEGRIDILLAVNNPATTVGIAVAGTSFDNHSNGVINVKGYTRGINVSQGTKFNNFGHLNLIDCIGYGVWNEGDFNNYGALNLSGITGFRNQLTGSLNNDGGVITDQGSSLNSIQNAGYIANKTCSDIIVKKRINMVQQGTINNYGYLACIEDGSSFGRANHLFNYGIINDPFDRFINTFDNQGVYIGSLDNLVADFFFEFVLDIAFANSFDFEVDENWYSQPPFNNTNYVGFYDQPSNLFWLDEDYSTNPLPYYYTTITHLPSGCDKIVKIRVNPAVLPPSAAALPPGSGLTDAQGVLMKSNSPIELSVFPNPSAGNFVVQFPKNSKGELEVRVIDLQGRVIAKYQKTEQAALSIDLEGQLAAGLYLLQVSQQGAVVSTERVVVE